MFLVKLTWRDPEACERESEDTEGEKKKKRKEKQRGVRKEQPESGFLS